MKQKWMFDNIPDLSGKTIIVTEGNSGLGFRPAKGTGVLFTKDWF